jgi:hypothetical protein
MPMLSALINRMFGCFVAVLHSFFEILCEIQIPDRSRHC